MNSLLLDSEDIISFGTPHSFSKYAATLCRTVSSGVISINFFLYVS